MVFIRTGLLLVEPNRVEMAQWVANPSLRVSERTVKVSFTHTTINLNAATGRIHCYSRIVLLKTHPAKVGP